MVAPGRLQSAVLVQPAMPASHIQGAYCRTPCEFGAPDAGVASDTDTVKAVDNPNPSPADNTASASPPLRPASTQPEASAAPQPEAPADSAAAPKPQGADTPVAGEKYKVVRGDMLSQIALQVYGDASKFRMIQAANPGLRNKPDRILVDQVIFIPPDKR